MAPLQLMWIAARHRVKRAFCFDLAYALCLQPLRWLGVSAPTCFLRGDALAVLKIRKLPTWLIRLASWMEVAALSHIRVVGTGFHLIDEILVRHPNLELRDVFELPNDMPVPKKRSRPYSSRRLRVALVGPLVPLKNQGFIIDMLSDASDESIALTIFGCGPEEANLKKKIDECKVGDRVCVAGWVPSHDIWGQVDLLMAPSLHEGMPNALLEALANGVPVLASDIPGHRMILPESFCLPLSEPKRWRHVLDELMDDADRRLPAMHESQLQFASRLQFDWDGRVVDLIVYGKL
jgi:glycosyltransferase involved in cell wall biosynthesis